VRACRTTWLIWSLWSLSGHILLALDTYEHTTLCHTRALHVLLTENRRSSNMAACVCVLNRAGSRDPVTYTFRTQFGLAIIHCVKQVEVQSLATEQPYTPPTVNRSTRRPSANYIPTSCSFGKQLTLISLWRPLLSYGYSYIKHHVSVTMPLTRGPSATAEPLVLFNA